MRQIFFLFIFLFVFSLASISFAQKVYTYEINGLSKTDLNLKVGEIVTITASGKISLGFFAGLSTPDGISGFESYSYFSNVPHGSLLYKIEGEDTWTFCGSNCSFSAKRNGALQFIVNDKDNSNNSGVYNVEVAVMQKFGKATQTSQTKKSESSKKSPAEKYISLANACNEIDYDCKILNITKAIQLDSSNPNLYAVRGLPYLKKKMYKEAIADYTKAIQLEPDNGYYYYYRGNSYYFKQNYDLAITDLTKAIQLKPNDADYYLLRGMTYSLIEKEDFAIADYTKAIQLKPNDASSYYYRGNSYYFKENYDLAITDFTKAIQLNPNDADYYYQRGQTYKKTKNFDLAITDFTKALQIKPNNVDYYYERAISYFNVKNYKSAISDFGKTIEVDPKNLVATFGLARSYKESGDYNNAIIYFSKAIALNPNQKLSYFYRSEAYRKLGDEKKANDDYKKYVELDNLSKTPSSKSESTSEPPKMTPTPIPEKKTQINLSGVWIATGYNCPGHNTGEEIVSVEHKGNSLSAKKIKGDDCIRSGEATFYGKYDGLNFPTTFKAKMWGAAPNTIARVTFDVLIEVIDENNFVIVSEGVKMVFRRK